MSKKQSANSSRVGFGQPTFDSFGSTVSPLSYLIDQPDLSSLSDSNVVVHFKNLSKKDTTTKIRALEDLKVYVTTASDLEDAFVECWVRVYPRTSIDLSRQVRQAAHVVNGYVALGSHKRFAKYMPRVIGPWLAGECDNDKSVVNSCKSAVTSVFTTSEKRDALRTIYQRSIAEHCRDSLIQETPSTLSDDRMTSREDSEALYALVVSSRLNLLTSLVTSLQESELSKQYDLYTEILQAGSLWDLFASPDSSIRQSILRFVKACTTSLKDLVEAQIDVISPVLLSKKALKQQRGTSYAFSQALLAISAELPTLWSHVNQSKFGIKQRLGLWLQNGSQGAPPGFWTDVSKIIQGIPSQFLPSSTTDIDNILDSIGRGIHQRGESVQGRIAGWNAYVDVFGLLLPRLSSEEERNDVVNTKGYALIMTYLEPSPTAILSIESTGPVGSSAVAKLLSNEALQKAILSKLNSLTGHFMEDLEASVGKSDNISASEQQNCRDEASRFLGIVLELLGRTNAEKEARNIFNEIENALRGCIQLVKDRDGLPVGVSQCIEAFLSRLQSSNLLTRPAVKQSLNSFLLSDIPRLVTSPSQPYLISVLYQCHSLEEFGPALDASVTAILGCSDSEIKTNGVLTLLTSPLMPPQASSLFTGHKLREFIDQRTQDGLEGSLDWTFVTKLLQLSSAMLPMELTDSVLAKITESLESERRVSNAIDGLRAIIRGRTERLEHFLSSDKGLKLIQNLLRLQETGDSDQSDIAEDLRKKLESFTLKEGSVWDLIQGELRMSKAKSLSVETIANLAQETFDKAQQPLATVMDKMWPDLNMWESSLQPYMSHPVPSSLAVSNELGGTLHFVYAGNEEGTAVNGYENDGDGLSIPMRFGFYVTHLTSMGDMVDLVSEESRAKLIRLLALTAILAQQNFALADSNPIWTQLHSESEEIVKSFIQNVDQLQDRMKEPEQKALRISSFLSQATTALLEGARGDSYTSYQNAKAHVALVAKVRRSFGSDILESTDGSAEQLKELRHGGDFIAFCAYIVALRPFLSVGPHLHRTVNELINDLVSSDVVNKPWRRLTLLVPLNLLLESSEDLLRTVAPQRRIWYAKAVIAWLSPKEGTTVVRAEIYKSLKPVMSSMREIYGEHWNHVLYKIMEFWSNLSKSSPDSVETLSEKIPEWHASAKVLQELRKLTLFDDANEDLLERWEERLPNILVSALNILKVSAPFSDEANLPLKLANQVTAEMIEYMPVTASDSDLFSLLTAKSSTIQRVGFQALHRRIPGAQEQISVDVAVENFVAQLPDALLSLISSPPPMDSIPPEDFSDGMPAPVIEYLSGWLLTFDHFKKAVRLPYAPNLR